MQTKQIVTHVFLFYLFVYLAQACSRQRGNVNLKCPKNRVVNQIKGKTNALVGWSRGEFQLRSTNQIKGIHQVRPDYGAEATWKHIYNEGTHEIVYQAVDVVGVYASCTFTIKVVVIRCPVITTPIYSTMKCNMGILEHSVCNITCMPGYHLTTHNRVHEDIASVHCQNSGVWSEVIPSCISDTCDDPGQLVNSIRTCTNDEHTINTYCTYHCLPGFIIENSPNETSSKIRCAGRSYGLTKWIHKFPKCIEIMKPTIIECPGHDIVVNATSDLTEVDLPSIVVVPTNARVHCHGAFGNKSKDSLTVGKHHIQCRVYLGEGGGGGGVNALQNNGFRQTCSFNIRVIAQLCPIIVKPPNSRIECNFNYNINTTRCIILCDNNYVLSSLIHRNKSIDVSVSKMEYTCLRSGFWSPSDISPRCVLKSDPVKILWSRSLQLLLPAPSQCNVGDKVKNVRTIFNNYVKAHLPRYCRRCIKRIRVRCLNQSLMLITYEQYYRVSPTVYYNKRAILRKLSNYHHSLTSTYVKNFLSKLPSGYGLKRIRQQRFHLSCSSDTTYDQYNELCKPCGRGRYVSDNECHPCARGSYQSEEAASTCDLCKDQLSTPRMQSVDASQCIYIDNCASNPCLNNASCTSKASHFNCSCNKRNYGQRCEFSRYDCSKSKCQNNSTCISIDSASYKCQCNTKHSGVFCEQTKVNGGWSLWSDWSKCSLPCRGHHALIGSQTRERRCDSPTPMFQGRPCSKNNLQKRKCNDFKCRECSQLDAPSGGELNCITTTAVFPLVEGSTVSCSVICRKGYALSTNLNISSTLTCGAYTSYRWPHQSDNSSRLPNCERTSIPIESRVQIIASSSYHCRPGDAERLRSALQTSASSVASSMLSCVKDQSCTVSVKSVNCTSSRSKRSAAAHKGDKILINMEIIQNKHMQDTNIIEEIKSLHRKSETFSLLISEEERLTVTFKDTQILQKVICADYQQPSYDGRYCVECSQNSIWIQANDESEAYCMSCDAGFYSYKRKRCKLCSLKTSYFEFVDAQCYSESENIARIHQDLYKRIANSIVVCVALVFLLLTCLLISYTRLRDKRKDRYQTWKSKIEYL